MTDAYVHLTSSDSAAGAVKATLDQLERNETVIAMRDSFTEGPLGDADAGGRCRIDWYKRLEIDLSDEHLSSFVDDADLWTHVRAADVDVMLWHGPHPAERIFALRACWHLRDRPERVYEVAIQASDAKWPGGRTRPQLYDAVAIKRLDVLVKAWDGRTRIADVEARAKRWEALRSTAGDWIRTLDGEDIVQLPLTAFDGLILAAASVWTESSHVLGRVLGDNPVGLAFLTWRVRELLRDGSLESRGENRFGLPTELRRQDRRGKST